MTRRKPLSKRLTALSLARNLTSKQEHQLVAAADRARHLEEDLAALLGQVERVRDLLEEREMANQYRIAVEAPDDGHSECIDASYLLRALDPEEPS